MTILKMNPFSLTFSFAGSLDENLDILVARNLEEPRVPQDYSMKKMHVNKKTWKNTKKSITIIFILRKACTYKQTTWQ